MLLSALLQASHTDHLVLLLAHTLEAVLLQWVAAIAEQADLLAATVVADIVAEPQDLADLAVAARHHQWVALAEQADQAEAQPEAVDNTILPLSVI